MKSTRLFLLILLFSSLTFLACGSPPPPPAPQGVATDVNKNVDGVIFIQWKAFGEDEEVIGYRVYRDKSATGTFKDKVYDGPNTEYTDKNVIVDQNYEITYYYKVTAYKKGYDDKDVNEGPPSPVVSAKSMNFSPPDPPQGLTVKASNIDSPQVRLTWQVNKEVDIKGYYVYRSGEDKPISAADESLIVSDFLEIKKGQTTADWTDTRVEPGKQYWYIVVAVDQGDLKSQNPPSLRKGDWLLEAVNLESPQAGATTTASPTFRWLKVNGAVGYVVVIQSQKFGGKVLWRSGFIKDTFTKYSGSALTLKKTHYWYVYAYSTSPASPDKEDGNSVSELSNFTPE